MLPSFPKIFTSVVLLFLSPTIISSAEPLRISAYRLGKPLIGDDGIVYACSDKFLYAFGSNGSIAWNIHLNYTCNGSIAPVYGGKRKVYIVAENRVLRISTFGAESAERAVGLLFGNDTSEEKPDDIIGLAVSMITSSVYINIQNKGLVAYSFTGRLRWNVVPVLDQFGYSQGCKENVTDCYFTSAPVIDDCETGIYISNNKGEIYSISPRRPHFKWIQNLSSFDKVMITTPGNTGFLYITLPTKAKVVALDVFTGDFLWERSIGPLNSAQHLPVVDANGWISVGSLDGFLYSISPSGILKKFSKASPLDAVIQVSPVLDCSGYAVYISQTEMEGKSSRIIGGYTYISAMKPKSVVFALLVPATESFYWSGIYPGKVSTVLGQFASNLSQSDLHNFNVDEEMVLAFIAAARIGNPLPCRSTRLNLMFSCSEVRPKTVSVYTGNERAILLFLLLETVILVVLAIVVRFCWVFWGKRKLKNQDLGKFLEKRHSLRLRKKAYDKTIFELEQKAAKEATTSEVLDNLSTLVREREGIKRKLSTTYSLGRDSTKVPSKSGLPISGGKTRSYPFRGSKNERVTMFHAYNDSGDESSLETDSGHDSHGKIELAAKAKGKAKAKEPVKVASSSDEGTDWEDFYGSSPDNEDRTINSDYERHGFRTTPSDGRTWLTRRRSLSSTN